MDISRFDSAVLCTAVHADHPLDLYASRRLSEHTHRMLTNLRASVTFLSKEHNVPLHIMIVQWCCEAPLPLVTSNALTTVPINVLQNSKDLALR
jgi:hypothetical protein